MLGRLLDLLLGWVPADLFDVDLGHVDDLAETRTRAALNQLDGTQAAAISLITGYSTAELDDLGGLDQP